MNKSWQGEGYMSFSKEVKEEISRHITSARHCQIAELASILSFCGRYEHLDENTRALKLYTESLAVARKYFTLVKKTFNISTNISIQRNLHQKKGKTYSLTIRNDITITKLLQATKLKITKDGEIKSADYMVMVHTCCKRAFLRGAFLASGSISDPEKTYHFEIVSSEEFEAQQIQSILRDFHVDAKIILRKKYYVVYVKEASQIVDVLNVMEAHVSLMNLENVRILKDMRNSINRQVNCEAANINKTVQAASKQLDDIKYINDTIGLNKLSEGLEDIAKLRFQYPEASLKELGDMLCPPIGKSGVNHRLRKISLIADHLREQKEEIRDDDKKDTN